MHDETHEQRCLDGQAEPSCPGCREFMTSMQSASDSARRAALAPPAWLDAQVLALAAPLKAVPRWPGIGLGLAVSFAAAALVVLPFKSEPPNLSWKNGIERDIARIDAELASISKQVAVDSDAAEIYQDLDRLERMTRSLKQQKL